MDENLIYWDGKPVGIDMGRYISWFPSAPTEAIKAFAGEGNASAK